MTEQNTAPGAAEHLARPSASLDPAAGRVIGPLSLLSGPHGCPVALCELDELLWLELHCGERSWSREASPTGPHRRPRSSPPVCHGTRGLHANLGWAEHEPAMASDIRVHIDTLEYTREGLGTRDRISLEVGQHNRIVLVRPQRVHSTAGFANVFAPGSVFPGPPVLATFLSAKAAGAMGDIFSHLFGGEPAKTFGVFQVYGHADAAGDEAANKALSEQRAELFRAFLLGDVDGFASLVEGESWGLAEQQAMLRVLQCDPGAIDGEPGALTEAAIHDFQADYVHGFFHRETELEPRNSSLAVDGDLGPQTEAALLEALVVACSPHITEDRLHPTHPTAGCATFNRVSEEKASLNRRVTLVLHEALPEHHDRAPCVVGDAAACPYDARSLSGCLWFREHVEDVREQNLQPLALGPSVASAAQRSGPAERAHHTPRR